MKRRVSSEFPSTHSQGSHMTEDFLEFFKSPPRSYETRNPTYSLKQYRKKIMLTNGNTFQDCHSSKSFNIGILDSLSLHRDLLYFTNVCFTSYHYGKNSQTPTLISVR